MITPLLMLAAFLLGGLLFKLQTSGIMVSKIGKVYNVGFANGIQQGRAIGWNEGREYEVRRRESRTQRNERGQFSSKN